MYLGVVAISDIAKWALLVAGLIAISALILSLPIFDIVNVNELSSAVSTITYYCSGAISAARGIVNYMFPASVRPFVSVAIGYMFLKFLIVWGIKIVSLAYSWIFK